MDFFNKLGDTIVSATHEVSGKAKEMTDVAKLQYEMKTKEDFLNKKYQEIGKMFFDENREVFPEVYTELFDDVEATLARMQDLREEIADLKGTKTCKQCGNIVDKTASFCSVCGTKIDDIFEEEE